MCDPRRDETPDKSVEGSDVCEGRNDSENVEASLLRSLSCPRNCPEFPLLSPSSDDESVSSLSSSELAYSLFDDYASSDVGDVYRHMYERYGFRCDALGSDSLHRIALVNYLNKIKYDGGNVLESYGRVVDDPAIVLDSLEEHLKPPFYNDRLIWGYVESSDGETD